MKTPFYSNHAIRKFELKRLLHWILKNYGFLHTCELSAHLKKLGFQYATQVGLSIGVSDLYTTPQKPMAFQKANGSLYVKSISTERSLVSLVDRAFSIQTRWTATSEILKDLSLDYFQSTKNLNPVYLMCSSGARGNVSQIRQLVAMRGLMSDSAGNVLELPIRSNFREGLTLAEYFISCYGARKGVVDTALGTAKSGYLTRRLSYSIDEIIISETDCKTTQGKTKQNTVAMIGHTLNRMILDWETFEPLAKRNAVITTSLRTCIESTAITSLIDAQAISVRSPLTCESFSGICQLCYGWSLGHKATVALGEGIGTLAAQSIGEPSTQLTMRTFHTGGVFYSKQTKQVLAPHSGKVYVSKQVSLTKIRTLQGEFVFFTSKPCLCIILERARLHSTAILIPSGYFVFLYPGQYLTNNEIIAQKTKYSLLPQVRRMLTPDSKGNFLVYLVETDNLSTQMNRLYSWVSGELVYEQIEAFFLPKLHQCVTEPIILIPTAAVKTEGFVWIFLAEITALQFSPCRFELIILHTSQEYSPYFFVKKQLPKPMMNTHFRPVQTKVNRFSDLWIVTLLEKVEPMMEQYPILRHQKNPQQKSQLEPLIYKKRIQSCTIGVLPLYTAYYKRRARFGCFRPPFSFQATVGPKNFSASCTQTQMYTFFEQYTKTQKQVSTYSQLLTPRNVRVCQYGFVEKSLNFKLEWFGMYTLHQGSVFLKYYYSAPLNDSLDSYRLDDILVMPTFALSLMKLMSDTVRKKFKQKRQLKALLSGSQKKNIHQKIFSKLIVLCHLTGAYYVCLPKQDNDDTDYLFSEKLQRERLKRLKQPKNTFCRAAKHDFLTLVFKLDKRINFRVQINNCLNLIQANIVGPPFLYLFARWFCRRFSTILSWAFFLKHPRPTHICTPYGGLWIFQAMQFPKFKAIRDHICLQYPLFNKNKEISEDDPFLILNPRKITFVTYSQKVPCSMELSAIASDVLFAREILPLRIPNNAYVEQMHTTPIWKHTLLYSWFASTTKTGDIIQGLPQLEKRFEARETFQCLFESLFLYIWKKYWSLNATRSSTYLDTYALSIKAYQTLFLSQLQQIYITQGIQIEEKHLEVIVRQVYISCFILDGGDSGFLPGDIVPRATLMTLHTYFHCHIRWASLFFGLSESVMQSPTKNFLTRSSFQRTKETLSLATINQTPDFLLGLKQNIIFGQLLPVGTGCF